MGTREFNRPDRPDEVSSADGELEMQQPAQSPTLPGQPAHAMQMQQPQGGGAAEMEAASVRSTVEGKPAMRSDYAEGQCEGAGEDLR